MGDLDRGGHGSDVGQGLAAEGAKHLAALERDGALKTPKEAEAMARMAYSLVCQDRAFWQARALALQRERDTLLDQIAANLVAASAATSDPSTL